MNRMFNLVLLSFAGVTVTSSLTVAQSIPDLKGSWTGTGKTIVDGPAPHHQNNPAATSAGTHRLSEMKFTITIEGQQDVRFGARSLRPRRPSLSSAPSPLTASASASSCGTVAFSMASC